MGKKHKITLDRVFTAHGQHWGPGEVETEDPEIANTLREGQARVLRNEGRTAEADAADELDAEEDENSLIDDRVVELMRENTKKDLVEIVQSDTGMIAAIPNADKMNKDVLARAIVEYQVKEEASRGGTEDDDTDEE